MYETTVTMVGRLATAVTQVTFDDGGVKASFRLASTERRFDRGLQQWVDGARLFLTVVCWRALAERVVDTLRTGDPVIVRGRLRSREYEKDGQVHRIVEVEATSIGPDLGRCSASLLRRDTELAGNSDGGGSRSAVGQAEEQDRRGVESRAEAAVGG
jgi:single-strand DNA-binding protein